MDTIEICDINKGIVFINIEHIVAIEPRNKNQEEHGNRCGSYIRVTGAPVDDYEVAKNPCEVMALIESKTSGYQYTMRLDEDQRKMFE